MHTDRLYDGIFITEFIKSIRAKLIEEIKLFEEKRNLNLEGEKERLKDKYTLGPLTLGETKPSVTKREKKMVYNDWGQQYEADIHVMKIIVPFEGNGNLFYCRPTSGTIVDPKIDSIDNQNKVIRFTIELRELKDEEYKKEIGKIISDIKENIPNVNRDILPWDSQLESLIENELRKFNEFVSEKNSFFESIGLKVTSQADQYITPSPVTRKSIPIPKQQEIGNIKKISPKLKEEVYLDIITTLNNVGRAIERKPSLYKGKSEEDLRDIFLLFLETRYESTSATGETFNKKGKTDILLKYANDGSNLFIGECKIWKGTKIFLETIDQILGYLTWQDSKSAILFFIDNESIDNVRKTIKSHIQSHVNFKKVGQESDDSFSYFMSLPDDNSILISLEIILFHLPDRK